jgi:hypothetical protein
MAAPTSIAETFAVETHVLLIGPVGGTFHFARRHPTNARFLFMRSSFAHMRLVMCDARLLTCEAGNVVGERSRGARPFTQTRDAHRRFVARMFVALVRASNPSG